MSTYISTYNGVGDGVKTNWDINFSGGYILPTHVFVVIDNGPPTVAAFAGPSTVVITPAVPNGTPFFIQRRTPNDEALVDFVSGAAVTETNLDLIAKQAVFVAADLGDRLTQVQDLNMGSRGFPGDTGPAGTPGTAATVTIGSVTTGGPGSPATVTNVGTSLNAVLNFSIPKGDAALTTTIADGSLVLAKLANLPTMTLMGNITGGAGVPTALTIGAASGNILNKAAGDALYSPIALPYSAKTASYTLALVNANSAVTITTGGVVIPANASVAFPVFTAIIVYNDSAVTQALTITTDTLRLAGTTTVGARTIAPRSYVTLLKVAATEWVASGPGLT